VVSMHESGVWVVVPHLPENLSEEAANAAQQVLLDGLFTAPDPPVHLLVLHDGSGLYASLAATGGCMIAWMSCLHSRASPALREHELNYSAVRTGTGGRAFTSKVHQHPNVYAFPSSDVAHFQGEGTSHKTQRTRHPLGFWSHGQRMDLELLSGIALLRPGHLVS